MLKLTNLFRSACLLLSCSLFCHSCHVKPAFPSSLGNMALTLTGIFSNCSSHLNSNQAITFSGVVQPSYYNGTDKEPLDPVSFSSGSNPTTPVVVNIKIPNQGWHYDIEIIVNGGQCSKCAMQSYNGVECIQYTDNNGYHAAKPRLDFKSYIFTTYYSTYTIDLSRGFFAGDAPGSCDCVVPQ